MTEGLTTDPTPEARRSAVNAQTRRTRKHSTLATIVAACAVPVLYLIYIAHYAVNVPTLDDWFKVSLIHEALHGHLTLGALWARDNETRIFLTNLIFVAFGVVDHLDMRTMMLFNAAIFILTFWLFLLLFRVYRGSRSGAFSVLTMSVVWFSLADLQSPLRGIQSAWYLVLFFFIAMIFLLLVSHPRRNVVFVLAVLIAIAGSCSFLQGFVLWPVGLICLLWNRPWVRRTYYECGLWISAATVTAVGYSIEFNTNSLYSGCGAGGCSGTFALHHPVMATRYFLLLVGNVVPSGSLSKSTTHLGRVEVVGSLILLASAYVVINSLRERRTQRRLPLPILLIAFAVLFDLLITLGRTSSGLYDALIQNRYNMPNLILLLGVVVYALAHDTKWKRALGEKMWHLHLRRSALGMLGIFLLIQCIDSTQFGITNGQRLKQREIKEARLVVNLDQVPLSARGCELKDLMWYGYFTPSEALAYASPILAQARQDHLSVFQPGAHEYHVLRAAGPPKLFSQCIPQDASPAMR